VHPEKYTRELTLIGAALLVTVVLAIVSPARRKVERPLTDQVSVL
jgi:hypothetical protein